MSYEKSLNIFSAGVAKTAVCDAIEKWIPAHSTTEISLTVDGSVSLIRRCLAGESCDLLILADNAIIDSMMIPEATNGYIVFAGNRMVVAANEGYDIDNDNWKDKLLDPHATFDHHDPFADPGGYRAIMTMLLADNIESGLADKLLSHPGHFGMGALPVDKPEIKYTFDYYTRALGRGASFAELPDIMDLSNVKLSDIYSQVEFSISESTTISGAPICHALTIPFSSKNRPDAKEFIKEFLSLDFASYGFVPRYDVVGDNIID